MVPVSMLPDAPRTVYLGLATAAPVAYGRKSRGHAPRRQSRMAAAPPGCHRLQQIVAANYYTSLHLQQIYSKSKAKPLGWVEIPVRLGAADCSIAISEQTFGNSPAESFEYHISNFMTIAIRPSRPLSDRQDPLAGPRGNPPIGFAVPYCNASCPAPRPLLTSAPEPRPLDQARRKWAHARRACRSGVHLIPGRRGARASRRRGGGAAPRSRVPPLLRR